MVQELVQVQMGLVLAQVPAREMGGERTVVALEVRCRFPGRVEVLGPRCTSQAPVVAVPGPQDRAPAPVLALEVESAAAPGRAVVLALEVESASALGMVEALGTVAVLDLAGGLVVPWDMAVELEPEMVLQWAAAQGRALAQELEVGQGREEAE